LPEIDQAYASEVLRGDEWMNEGWLMVGLHRLWAFVSRRTLPSS
jgi:hypothetical protein